ncbi:MAG: hypothetical protein ACOYLB_01710 [Phototrophicaceae bacterium]
MSPKRPPAYLPVLIGCSCLMLVLMGACGSIVGPTAMESTLQAQNFDLSTQLALVRSTATVEMARMLVTVEVLSTESRELNAQRDRLVATLQGRGTDVGFIQSTLPDGQGLPEGISADLLLSGLTPLPATTQLGATTLTGNITPTPAVTPTPPILTRLLEPTLSNGVNSNDCASTSLTSFSADTPEIYIVARALDLKAGSVVTARWTYEGAVRGQYDIPFDFDVSNACIWAYIDQSDFEFTPGNWTVALDVDGYNLVAALPFSITAP